MSASTALVTGATGMVGNLAARRLLEAGYRVRVMLRPSADRSALDGLDVEFVNGDLARPETLQEPLQGVDYVIHTAAHVGDWGPAEKYRAINVVALEHMLTAAQAEGRIQRWVQVSSLGVYDARHHFGTDESEPVNITGLDGYTRTKAEAEVLLKQHMDRHLFPAVILRPGFIYGRGDRHVVPRLVERIRAGKMKLIGDGKRVLNNTCAGNLVDAILLALDNPAVVGHTFNIRDQRLVTRSEFVGTIADYLGKSRPGSVPEWVARAIVRPIEGLARMSRASEAPMLTQARIKFLTLNLDFSIDKAKDLLGYKPQVDFQHGIREALAFLDEDQPAKPVAA